VLDKHLFGTLSKSILAKETSMVAYSAEVSKAKASLNTRLTLSLQTFLLSTSMEAGLRWIIGKYSSRSVRRRRCTDTDTAGENPLLAETSRLTDLYRESIRMTGMVGAEGW